jgi:hypothetical protein
MATSGLLQTVNTVPIGRENPNKSEERIKKGCHPVGTAFDVSNLRKAEVNSQVQLFFFSAARRDFDRAAALA